MTRKTVSVDVNAWVDKAIRDTKSKYMAVTAGYGAGKTHGAVQWIDQRRQYSPQCKLFCFTEPVGKLFKRAVFPTFKKVYSSYGWVQDVHYKYVLSNDNMGIYFPYTDQFISFLTVDDPSNIVAFEAGAIVMDESALCKEEAFEKLTHRLRASTNIMPQMLLPTTTEGLNWMSNAFDSDNNSDQGWIKNSNKDAYRVSIEPATKFETRYRRFRLSTFDNPHRAKGYAEGLLELYKDRPNFIKGYIYGYFVPLFSGNAYANYRDEHDIEDIDPDPNKDLVLTWDFNANPLAWVSLQEETIENDFTRFSRWNAIHESSGGDSTLDDSVVDFAMKHPLSLFNNTPIYIYGDMSGYQASHRTRENDYEIIRRKLTELGYKRVFIKALKYNPLETVSVEAVNTMFLNLELGICKRCKNLRTSLLVTRWQENVKKLLKGSKDKWSHWTDALKYFCYALNNDESATIENFEM